MQPHNYISSFEDLKKWFDLQQCVKWNLYRGFHERMPERSIIYKQREDQATPDESWSQLQEMIQMNGGGGGKFTIFVPVYGAAKGASILFGFNLAPTSLAPGIGGFSGTHQSSPYAVGMVPQSEIDRRIQDAIERERLNRKVQDLEAAADSKDSWQDILFQKVLELDADQVLSAVGNILGKAIQPAPMTPVTMRGLQQQEEQDQQQPGPDPEGVSFEYDGARLMPALDTMCRHFGSEDEFIDFLENVADKFDKNPALYKSMING